jgi:hypothetical protein
MLLKKKQYTIPLFYIDPNSTFNPNELRKFTLVPEWKRRKKKKIICA